MLLMRNAQHWVFAYCPSLVYLYQMGIVLTSQSLKHRHILFTHRLMFYWLPGNNFTTALTKRKITVFQSNINENEAPGACRSDSICVSVTGHERCCCIESVFSRKSFFLSPFHQVQLGAFRLCSSLAGNYTWHPWSSGM